MLKPVPVEPVLSVKELYTLYYFHHESGYRFAGESHDFWEIIYVDKGRASGINGTEPYTLEKGQIIFHHPNVFHNFRTDGAPDAEDGADCDIFVVSFNGDPKAANLNVQAVYTVNSASLNDLIADASSSRGNVRVNCLLNLSGNLTSPSLTFGLELPTVSEEDRELVRSLTSTEEQMNTQIIYLLGVGKFYTYDYANNTGQTDATSSLAFSTLSGQLNNMLSQVIDNQNWNVGTNLTTGEKGWSDVEAEAILSGRLLNNRLIINGNFGYRENTMRNTNFVGDFEAIWLLTKNGEFRLRGYNQTNDRYFTKSTLTTQGIGIMYKKDFMNWKELVDWFLRRRKNRSSQQKEKEDQKYLPQEALPAAREKRESNEK